MSDRIRRPKSYDKLLKELRDKENIFRTYKDILIFAACLGFKSGKRVSFKESSEPIKRDIFNGTYDSAVINAIALLEKNDTQILTDGCADERIAIFEEYACGGLEIIQREIADGPDDWENGFLAMIHQEKGEITLLDDVANLS